MLGLGTVALYILLVASLPTTTPETETTDSTSNSTGSRTMTDVSTVEVTDVTEESTVEVTDVTDKTTVEVTDVTDKTTVEVTDVTDKTTVEVTDVTDKTTVEVTDATEESTAEVTDVTEESTVEVTDGALTENTLGTTPDFQPLSVPLFNSSILGNITEFHVGMETVVMETITLPEGCFPEVSFVAGFPRVEHVDIRRKECVFGRNVKKEHFCISHLHAFKSTGFERYLNVAWRFYNLTVSATIMAAERQIVCAFTLILHNANGLADGERISSICTLEVLSNSEKWTFNDNIIIHTKPLKFLNKTAFFRLEPMNSTVLQSEIKSIKKINFQAWLPYYNPKLTVMLSGESRLAFGTNFEATYLKVLAAGNNFYPGIQPNYLNTINMGDAEANATILSFPDHFINTGYYNSENTTDDDIIEFEAGVALSEMAAVGSRNNVSISLLINGTQVWNFTLTLVAAETISNGTCGIKIEDNPLEDLFPFSHVILTLEICIPGGRSDTLNCTVFIEETSALGLQNVVLSKSNEKITDISIDYSLTESGGFINLDYLSWDDIGSNSSVKVDLAIALDPERVRFSDAYSVSISNKGMGTKRDVHFNKPEILNDENGKLLSTIHLILDNNITTCLRLPVNGEVPPLLWMKMNTSWLGITPKEYKVTFRGVDITCNSHGRKSLLVSFPTASLQEPLHGDSEFCHLIHEDDIFDENLKECEYKCECKDSVECGELFVSMANQDKIPPWELCDVSAVNV